MNNRNNIILMIYAVSACVLASCNDESETVPQCSETQRLVGNVCVDKPCSLCTSTQKCVNNTCVDDPCAKCTPEQKCMNDTCYDKDECVPSCGSDQKCYAGTCYPIGECHPTCQPGYECLYGECQEIDPTACSGLTCNGVGQYCKEGHWSDCPDGTGCFYGYCIEDMEPDCNVGSCNDDKSMWCDAGTWVRCNETEKCINGTCQFSLADQPCEIGSCSEDGSHVCLGDKNGEYLEDGDTEEEDNKKGVWKKCDTGLICSEGVCKKKAISDAQLLWQLCSSNADCANGTCLKSVTTSRPMRSEEFELNQVASIPVRTLDSRIPPGMGICSEDCTLDKEACENISTTNDSVKFTCQLVAVQDSPYPPKNSDGVQLSLPFTTALNLDDMNTPAFAALCRPNDAYEEAYSKKMCESCSSTADCGDNEVCFNNVCYERCDSHEECPLTFKCMMAGSLETHLCMPQSRSCGACRDIDRDGQGVGGHCDVSGYDCDDLSPSVYYNKPLNTCSTTPSDDNCNGQIDLYEMIGPDRLRGGQSNESSNCASCGDTCIAPDSAMNFTRSCSQLTELDPENPQNSYKFKCVDACTPGWADCDGDLSNGCEVQLVEDISDPQNVTTVDGIAFGTDKDGDGFAAIQNPENRIYCCPGANELAWSQRICYAIPNTEYSSKSYWAKTETNKQEGLQSAISDCDDERAAVHPGATELCNNIDDDCDASTADGSGDFYIDTHNGNKKLSLNSDCTKYSSSGSTCSNDGNKGKVLCENNNMVCFLNSAEKDETCDGIDDNCNGQIDEDYVPKACDITKDLVTTVDKSVNICSKGALICRNGKTECKQMFKPRQFDFYGDGIDSNCDGFDYDDAHTVTLAPYTGGTHGGSNTSSGSTSFPQGSWNNAMNKACTSVIDDKGLYKNICYDVFVSINFTETLENSTKILWAREEPLIPSFASNTYYNPNLKYESTKDEYNSDSGKKEKVGIARELSKHIEQYQKIVDYNANGYAYPGEVYPPKAQVRVYGGMSIKDIGGQSDYKPYWYKDGTTRSYYNFVSTYTSNGGYQTLIRPNNTTNPMSLYMKDMVFTMKRADALPSDILKGMTYIGFSCSRQGCRYVKLDNVKIEVIGANGYDHSATEFNEAPGKGHWEETYSNCKGCSTNTLKKDGAPGYGPRADDNSNETDGKYKDNRQYSYCLIEYQTGNFQWKYYNDSSVSYLISDYVCPDGWNHRGGCGGYSCCKNSCTGSYNKGYGDNGEGSNSGSGDQSRDLNTGNGCGTSSDFETTKATAGTAGVGGAGGTRQGMSIKVYDDAPSIYCSNPESANGSAGQTGGGGGGGQVYRCYARDGSDDYWAAAGGGGKGGCGGAGGKAGGTAVTAIGMSFYSYTNGDSGNSEIYLTNDSKILVTGGSGGGGQDGQNGLEGGTGGAGYGFGRKKPWDLTCIKATAGADGGAGGGGGGGAAGNSGEAYGIVFRCKDSKVTDFSVGMDGSTEQLAKCHFQMTPKFLENPGIFIETSVKNNGSDGTKGKDGKDKTSFGTGGSGGKAGVDFTHKPTVAKIRYILN